MSEVADKPILFSGAMVRAIITADGDARRCSTCEGKRMTPAEPVTVDGALIERVAKIIDPYAWNVATPTEEAATRWFIRRYNAKNTAVIIIHLIAHELKQGKL